MGTMSAVSGAHVMSPCHYKKGKQWLSTPLLVQEACSPLPRAFLYRSSTTSSPWSFISLEIMDSDTVYAADLWVKA